MKITIQYRSDRSNVPYCAFTYSLGAYECHWSSKSFEDAKKGLLNKLASLPVAPTPLEDEEVEI